MVAIARGVSLGATVLVLDEPTSSLAEREVAILYDLMRRLRAGGTAIVYISHRFDELYAVCDRVTVLRDGSRVATREPGRARAARSRLPDAGQVARGAPAGHNCFPDALLTRMRRAPAAPLLACGEAATRAEAARASRSRCARARSSDWRGCSAPGAPRRRARCLRGRPGGHRRCLSARAAARPAHARPGDRGRDRVPVRGPQGGRDHPRAVRAREPDARGAADADPVRHRLARPAGGNRGPVHGAPRASRRPAPDQKIRELSGGNQQKVLLARWLCTLPRC